MKKLFKSLFISACFIGIAACSSTDGNKKVEVQKWLKISVNSGSSVLLEHELSCDNSEQVRFGGELMPDAMATKNYQAKYISGVVTIIGSPSKPEYCASSIMAQADLFSQVNKTEMINGAPSYQGDFIQTINMSAMLIDDGQTNQSKLVEAAFIISVEIIEREVVVY